MTTEIGIDGSVYCRDENGIIWSWINGDGGLTVRDVNIKHDDCLTVRHYIRNTGAQVNMKSYVTNLYRLRKEMRE